MYNGDDTYTCDLCGFTEKWDATDDVHGDMWGCEKCGATFCSKCLRDAIGEKGYWAIMRGSDNVLCPDCAKEAMANGEFDEDA